MSEPIKLSILSPAAREQIRKQIGDEAYKALTKKRGRYRVSPKEQRTCDGIVFSSKIEKEAYEIITRRVPAERITLQPRFELQGEFKGVDGKKVRKVDYVGDFLLGPPRALTTDPLAEDALLIDVKGVKTVEFRIKVKLFMQRYRAIIHTPRTLKQLDQLLKENGY